jgi:hypothetical protein
MPTVAERTAELERAVRDLALAMLAELSDLGRTKRTRLAALYSRLTPKQQELFSLTFPAPYPHGVAASSLDWAIDIAERTIAKNEAEGRG